MLTVKECKVRDYRTDAPKNWSYRDVVRERNKRTLISVSVKGETVLDDLINRRSRPYDLYRTNAVPAALEALGLPLETKVRWSQKAGCSCGCSPAFIVDGDRGRHVWVTVEGEQAKVSSDPAAKELADRRAAGLVVNQRALGVLKKAEDEKDPWAEYATRF